MAKATFTIFAVLGLAATSLIAQPNPELKINIPFYFMAGGKTYPAGGYSVLVDSPVVGAVAIYHADSKVNGSVLARPVQSQEKTGATELRFNRYGDRYFLSQVWTGDTLGREMLPSRAEREQIAFHGKPQAVVSLSAQR